MNEDTLMEVLHHPELPLASKALYLLILEHPKGVDFATLSGMCNDKPMDITNALRRLSNYVSYNGVAYRVK